MATNTTRPGRLAASLWGDSSSSWPVWLFACAVLFAFLGTRELWTQEGRWAAIVSEMILRGDYFHPYLIGEPYYYKPLLSYWLVLAFSYLTGGLNEWALRLPSAIAGLGAVWGTYRLALLLNSRGAALVVAWMLVTTLFFVFWARVSSADMLNTAGIVLAVLWYFEHRDRRDVFSYMGFFLIIAVTSLTKGLVGAAVPVVALLPDLWSQGRWRLHLNWRLPLALAPALIVYFVPFLTSSYLDTGRYDTSGLSMVVLENFTRYFQAFDHKGPIYAYALYLPLYLMPWAFFFFPALWHAVRDWKSLGSNEKWPVWATLLLFLFFTASGSRRGYYILPVVPFAAIMTSDWVVRRGVDSLRSRLAACLVVFSAVSLLIWMCLVQPLLVNRGAAAAFGSRVRSEAHKVRDWREMAVVMSGGDVKTAFYLQPALPLRRVPVKDLADSLAADPCRVVVTEHKRTPRILEQVTGYDLVAQSLRLDKRLLGRGDPGRAVALIPTKEMCQKGKEATTRPQDNGT